MFRFLCTLLVVLISYFEIIFRNIFPRRKKELNGKVVLITGGGGGLAKQMALNFAKHDATVVLWDVDKENNDRNAALVKAMNLNAFSYCCDCTNEEEVSRVAAQVEEEIGSVDILINNAGILNGNSITMLTDKQIRNNFEVNIMAHFWTIKAFLPSMMQRNEGHIVTIASSAGRNGTAYLTDYSSSKFASIGLHESLSLELREQGFHDIQMTCICPNFVNTGMAWYPKTKVPWLIPILKVEDVAEEIRVAVQEQRSFVVLPKVLGMILAVKRLIPQRGQLAIYDYLGLGIEPQISRKKTSFGSKRSPKFKG